VIGILLFISLLLSLFVGVETANNAQADVRNAASPAEVSQLERLLDQVTNLKSKVTAAVSLGGEEEAKRKKIMLENELSAMQAQIDKTSTTLPAANAPTSDDIRKELEAASTTNKVNKAESDKLAEEARKKSEAVQALTAQTEKLEASLLEEQRAKDDIWLIPEPKGTTKKPLIVIANKDDFVVKTLDGAGSQVADKTGKQLKDLLREYDPVDYYVVMYYRPSTFHIFERAADTIREMKFDLGYDAIAEDQNINFRKKQTP